MIFFSLLLGFNIKNNLNIKSIKETLLPTEDKKRSLPLKRESNYKSFLKGFCDVEIFFLTLFPLYFQTRKD